jgi:competence protein ComEA
MLPENPRERAGLAVAALTLLGLGVAAWAGGQVSPPANAIRVSPEPTGSVDPASPAPETAIAQVAPLAVPEHPAAKPAAIVVHVSGKVRQPGVYTLPPGSRLQRAIHAAGGFGRNADKDALNLAARLEDSDQIVVPMAATEGAIENALDQEKPTTPVQKGTPSRGRVLGKPSPADDKPKPPSRRKFSTPGDGTVSLNSADSDALQQLPGVGKSTAERILEARKAKGRFQTIEDLATVKGIGEKRLEKLRPFLKLD